MNTTSSDAAGPDERPPRAAGLSGSPASPHEVYPQNAPEPAETVQGATAQAGTAQAGTAQPQAGSAQAQAGTVQRGVLSRVVNGRSLLTVCGALFVIAAMAGSTYLPHLPGRGIEPLLPMNRMFEPGRGHRPTWPASSALPARPGPGLYGTALPAPVPTPAGGRPGHAGSPGGSGEAVDPRVPVRGKHGHFGHHGKSPMSALKHLQCKILHRRC